MIVPCITIRNSNFTGIPNDQTIAEIVKKYGVTGHLALDVDEESIPQVFELAKATSSVLRVKGPISDVQSVVRLLDGGVNQVVLTQAMNLDALTDIPRERLALELSESAMDKISDDNLAKFGTLLFHAPIAAALDARLKALSKSSECCVCVDAPHTLTADYITEVSLHGYQVQVPITLFSAELSLGAAIAAPLVSDRQDGLFATVVVDEFGIALGLVYSSKESIAESVNTMRGVYQSRKRGLWYKGETSGAVQHLISIYADCDNDSLRFVVKQAGTGFCHLETRSCFGQQFGLSELERSIKSRKENLNTDEKSYTNRLFKDRALLHAKIVEEAGELCDATKKDEICWEAADLFYFAMVKCAAENVELRDVEAHLARRHLKLTRRPGNAKVPLTPVTTEQAPAKKEPATNAADTTTDAKAEIQLQQHVLQGLSEDAVADLCKRPAQSESEFVKKACATIIDDVRKRGDTALLELTAKFDKVTLASPVIDVASTPAPKLDPEVRDAIDLAFNNIQKFHAAQVSEAPLSVETQKGVQCSRYSRPIQRVGLYVPGGTAVLPSTALMLGVPAMVAGCSTIVFATPPTMDGGVPHEILYIAQKVGAQKILLAGGAQAVAAMSYGTASVPKVDKICGPGNQFVTAAKMFVQNDANAAVSIDMPAGPSEVMVICDANADAEFVAIDLLSQAEHGVDSQVILVAVDMTDAQVSAIDAHLERLTCLLPREDIIRVALSKSLTLRVDTLADAMAFSNQYAPEHLIVNIVDYNRVVPMVQCAGSVFLGPYSPESCGDYASGTNHTLPTYGYARMYSGVSTSTFQNYITMQELNEEGLMGIGPAVATLAALEKLDAHRNAVVIRMNRIKGAQ
ncbi:hypothetical protein SARC_00730 [Sphaeroforma arctica JP610]|uniref:Phosphoribosyl-AMP cyclohydrolase domain-containing protein n=1 Tax=Sphaeroforma arctica JP610 TaxID=667725 RepID=A0A0L0GE31_9EUKA|nr:hypothetical protein SARC_00730 [Sphaeroforma arctica JP610]KNC87149.1 hypothetical protein SARC_00730 [Sphaeroforma arctica JP610]|eukprot:XP_014161051.1 hypothetical protein SARC_00730 [Sphaeroforma arctica JP610]